MDDDQPGQSQAKSSEGSPSGSVPAKSQEQKQESVAVNSKTDDRDYDSQRAPDVLAFKENIKKGWAFIKTDDFQGPATAISTVFIAFFTFTTWMVILTGSGDTKKAADAADRFAGSAQKIECDLQDTVANVRQALADNNKDITQTLAENRSELAKALDQNRQSLQSGISQSKTALDASIAATELDQRAWIAFRGIDGVPQLNQEWSIKVFFLNSGRTPAKNVRISCKTGPATGEDSVIFKEEPYGQSTLISPGDESTYCELHPMTIPKVNQDVLDALTNKTVTIYTFGSVSYDDVFGKSHWVTFCRSMHPDGKAWDACHTHQDDTGDGKYVQP